MRVLLLLVVLLTLAAPLAAQEFPPPPTAPTWKGVITGTGITPTYETVPGDRLLDFIQVIESDSWTGSFWGVTWEGQMVQICPTFSTDADTSVTLPVGAAFWFHTTKLQWIITHSGTATFWGQGGENE